MINQILKEMSRKGYEHHNYKICFDEPERLSGYVVSKAGEKFYFAATEYGCVIRDAEDDNNFDEIMRLNGYENIC